ncbi:MAG: antibiotic biosynthesis monooxygenase family protein [Chloroflexota bacterium]
MPQVMLMRPVRFLPGKVKEGIEWTRAVEPIRRHWGMRSQTVARGIVDTSSYLLIQVWESQEAYNRWKASEDRARLVVESRRFCVYDPSVPYEIIEP